MSRLGVPEAALAAGLIPSGVFVMTAAFESRRLGMRVTWVQQCGFSPLLVSVALAKGHTMAPLLQESRAFALSQLADDDRFLLKRFFDDHRHTDDSFDAVETETFVTGAPVIKRALSAMDCRIVSHLDLESDHELYVGEVVAGRVLDPSGRPSLQVRPHGLEY